MFGGKSGNSLFHNAYVFADFTQAPVETRLAASPTALQKEAAQTLSLDPRLLSIRRYPLALATSKIPTQ
jgi:hypothetical protein